MRFDQIRISDIKPIIFFTDCAVLT